MAERSLRKIPWSFYDFRTWAFIIADLIMGYRVGYRIGYSDTGHDSNRGMKDSAIRKDMFARTLRSFI